MRMGCVRLRTVTVVAGTSFKFKCPKALQALVVFRCTKCCIINRTCSFHYYLEDHHSPSHKAKSVVLLAKAKPSVCHSVPENNDSFSRTMGKRVIRNPAVKL